MHRAPSSRHRHVELRLVRLSEGRYRDTDNDLVNGLALARMTCYRYALVEVNCFGGFDEAPILEMDTGLVDVAFLAVIATCCPVWLMLLEARNFRAFCPLG